MSEPMNKLVAKETLFAVADALDSLNIPFFLICGTALGAFRDHDFCRLDSDIDLGVLCEDIEGREDELLKTCTAFGLSARWIENGDPLHRAFSVKRPGVHADIVGFRKAGSERYIRDSHRRYALVYSSYLLENARPIEFLGRTFRIPNPPETYLRREYGEYEVESDTHVSLTRVYGYDPAKSLAEQNSGSAMLARNIDGKHLHNIYGDDCNYYGYLETEQVISVCWRPLFERLQKTLGDSARVVDIGCGIGTAANALPPGWTYLGFDGSDNAIAKAKATHKDLATQFYVNRIETFSSSEPCDVLIVANMLGYVVRRECRVRFVERYLDLCRPKVFVVIDMDSVDFTDLNARYRLLEHFPFRCDPPGLAIPEIKRKRKARIYGS